MKPKQPISDWSLFMGIGAMIITIAGVTIAAKSQDEVKPIFKPHFITHANMCIRPIYGWKDPFNTQLARK